MNQQTDNRTRCPSCGKAFVPNPRRRPGKPPQVYCGRTCAGRANAGRVAFGKREVTR